MYSLVKTKDYSNPTVVEAGMVGVREDYDQIPLLLHNLVHLDTIRLEQFGS